MTSQPRLENHFDSARVEKRGPWMTTIVPGLVRLDLEVPQRLDRDRPHLRAVRIGEADVRGDRAVVERVLAAARAIDDLIGDDHRARLHVRLQRAARGRPDDARDAELFERPRVGAVVDRSAADSDDPCRAAAETRPCAPRSRPARSCPRARRTASRPKPRAGCPSSCKSPNRRKRRSRLRLSPICFAPVIR